MTRRIDQPIFVIGTGRSGTTVVFELLASHPEVAWLSQYANRFPRFPPFALLNRLADRSHAFRKSTGPSDRPGGWLEKLRVGPVEAYEVIDHCCGERFRYDFLLGEKASPEAARRLQETVAGCLRWHGKPRFATKFTGPGRIGYLSSVFPDALFLHVLRDGRAVVQSLLRVPFWRESFRMHRPAWENGLTERDLEAWRASGHSPLVLAALQWRACVERTREEARELEPHRYSEIRYEDFVRDPHAVFDETLGFLRLTPSPRVHDFLERRFELRDRNYQWRERFSEEEKRTLEQLLGPCLASLGYRLESSEGA